MAQTKQLLWKTWFSTATRSRISTGLPHLGWSHRFVLIREALFGGLDYKRKEKKSLNDLCGFSKRISEITVISLQASLTVVATGLRNQF